ncbi:T9SS type A sorting domain-containing protein [bacterium]|nr:T9SS type A sorting domain-containing protein [bacterium]
MKSKIPNLFILIVLVMCIHYPASVLAISRIHDPIVIRGEDIPAFLDNPVEEIRIFRYIETHQWEPILFQVDELDGSDVYYGEKNNHLDGTDEIVFLARDLGEKAPEQFWPSDLLAQHQNRYEILVADPVNTDETGYAYIFLSNSLETLNDSYFNINQDEDWVKTPTYTVWHDTHGFQGGLFLHRAAGGDSINIIERQKLRVIAKISSDEFAIKEEQDGKISIFNGLGSIDAYVGPRDIQYISGGTVRLHRYLELEYRFKGKVLTYNLDHQGSYKFLTTFYPTFAEWKSGELEIKEISSVDIRKVRITTDLGPNALGMKFFNQYNNDPPLRIDQTNDSYDDTIPWPGNSWYMIVANPEDPDKLVNQATLLTITKIPSVPRNSNGSLYFKDTDSKVKYDTGDKESWGDTGFQMSGNSLKGTIDFYTASYYLPENLSYTQGENLASLHLNPLQLNITPQVKTYRLFVNFNPSSGGKADISPELANHPAYSLITVTAVPYPGYDFIGWTGQIESDENPLSFEIEDNTTLIAHFEPIMHDITISSDPQGLSFTADETLFSTPETFSWQESTMHSIQIDSIIEENSSYRLAFLSWDPVNTRNFQFTVDTDSQFTASYFGQYKLTAESEDILTGQVSLSSQDSWFNQGTSAVCLAIPAPDYRFSHWSGDTTSNLPELTLTMDQSWSVTAHFINAPPIIIAADTSVAEDDTLKLTCSDIERWVQDDNTPVSSLKFSFTEPEYLTAKYDSATCILNITPALHWSGKDTVWITAADPLGASTTAPMTITVNPVPDPPSSFALLKPENETGMTEWPTTIEFTWCAAVDPDPNDTLTYIFELDSSHTFQSPVKIHIENIQWMQYILLWPDYLGDNTYYWRVLAKDKSGLVSLCESPFSFGLTTNVVASSQAVPKDFLLEQNYPNPFNSSTTIRYGLPRNEQVTLVVFNSYGQMVKTLFKGNQKAGYHTVLWHGCDDRGGTVSSGMYMIVLQSENRKWVKKVLLLQ